MFKNNICVIDKNIGLKAKFFGINGKLVNMSLIAEFQQVYPSLESYWRSIILFGKNTASYKFALSKSLLEIVPSGKSVITLDDLAEPFSRYLCEHIKYSPKQTINLTSPLLDACNLFNQGKLNKDELINITIKNGFKYVIDAFHNVNGNPIPIEFYSKNYTNNSKGIILTDDLFKLAEKEFFKDLTKETEARWCLVEKAWELGISTNLLTVNYNSLDNMLYEYNDVKRRCITSARDALNGYQKGKCFYCFDDISVDPMSDKLCDIDHFFPHTLQSNMRNVNLDGVWNLVLACPHCNRGIEGKSAKIPLIKYLNRLHKRNEFLISSHHPLRETIILQTGDTPEKRFKFLQEIDTIAINYLIHRWSTPQVGEEVF